MYSVDVTAMMSTGYTGKPSRPPSCLTPGPSGPGRHNDHMLTRDTAGCRPERLTSSSPGQHPRVWCRSGKLWLVTFSRLLWFLCLIICWVHWPSKYPSIKCATHESMAWLSLDSWGPPIKVLGFKSLMIRPLIVVHGVHNFRSTRITIFDTWGYS